ncbi:MAG: hypothetical protein J0H71_05570 [Rhizobiales bacterium]|nr:hypothetical protein [Hyphomicrobiales bacterium]
MSGLILPNATLGVIHRIGEIMSPDFKNGVCVFVRDNLVTLRIFKDGAKFYEVSFGEAQCGQMAEFFKRAADLIERQGGSGLPPSKLAKAEPLNPSRT